MSTKFIRTEPVLGLNRHRLIDRCQDLIESGQEATFIYLVATRRLLDRITEAILDGERVRGCRELRVFLFDGLVRNLLTQAGEDRRPIKDHTKFFLLEQSVGQLLAAERLEHLAPIALLPGTIESIGKLIGEIKRAGMSPDLFREFITTAAPRPRDLDVAAIYEAYQRILDDHSLMDSDEAYARALDLLRSRPALPPGLSGTKMLFIDGFFDFTPIQKHLLKYLVERIPEVIVNLIYDPDHPSVFDEPLADTFRFFQKLTEPPESEHYAAMQPHDAALDHLRSNLFNPAASISSNTPPIRVLAGANVTHEVEEMANEIKRLIVEDGYRPDEIAIIVRELSGYWKTLQETLTGMGIPTARDIEEPLAAVPSVKAAIKVLDGRVGMENTEPYLQLLKNDYLEHFSPLDRDAVENAVLAVGTQIPLRQWRSRAKDLRRIKQYELEQATERFIDPEEMKREIARLKRGIEQLVGALEAIEGMREALADIPDQGTLSEMIEAFLHAIESFGLQQRLGKELKEAGRDQERLRLLARDLRGLEALRQTLGEIRHITEAGNQGLPTSDQRLATSGQFHDLIVHLVARTPFRTERGDPAGVQLLEATQARGLPFRVVFVAGLIEGMFPMAPVRDWVYPSPERERLAEAGLFLEDLSPKVFEAKEEHFFYHAVCQATERLYLTYPRASFTGEEHVVSSFVEEIRRLYHDGDESLVPIEELSPTTYEIRSIASASDLKRAVVANLYQTTADDALAVRLYNHALSEGVLNPLLFPRLRMEEERQGWAYSPFDGLLLDPMIHRLLRHRYGSAHVYSASQLNTYGRCPFQFFCQRILGLDEREVASLDLVAIERGQLLHTILHEFLQRHVGMSLLPTRKREYEREMERIAEETFTRFEERALPLQRSLWGLEKARILDTLMQFLEAEIEYQEQVSTKQVQPHWLELGFGMSDRGKSHPDSRSESLTLERDQDMIKVRGRIDRVDRSVDGKYVIYDYKSGLGSGLKEMRAGIDLQLQLYIKALASLFLSSDEAVIGGGYYSLREFKRNRGLYLDESGEYTGNTGTRSKLSADEWSELVEGAVSMAWSYVAGMRRGDFRIQPNEDSCCPRCLYQPVCRFEKHRIRAKAGVDSKSDESVP